MKHHHHDSEHNVHALDGDHAGGANRDDHDHVMLYYDDNVLAAAPHHHHSTAGHIIYCPTVTGCDNDMWLAGDYDTDFGPSDHDHGKGQG